MILVDLYQKLIHWQWLQASDLTQFHAGFQLTLNSRSHTYSITQPWILRVYNPGLNIYSRTPTLPEIGALPQPPHRTVVTSAPANLQSHCPSICADNGGRISQDQLRLSHLFIRLYFGHIEMRQASASSFDLPPPSLTAISSAFTRSKSKTASSKVRSSPLLSPAAGSHGSSSPAAAAQKSSCDFWKEKFLIATIPLR